MNKSQKSLYERDFYAWIIEQAELFKHKKFDQLDFSNILEEVEAWKHAERHSLQSAIKQLIAHLLKLQFQPEKNGMDWNNPDRLKKSSWEKSVDNQRDEIAILIKKMPSLKNSLKDQEWINNTWFLAVSLAAKETGLPKKSFPASPIWTIEQILDDDFYPNVKPQA